MSLKKIAKLPSKEFLDKVLEYKDGELYWKFVEIDDCLSLGIAKEISKAKCRNTRYAGKQAGHIFTSSSGSKSIQIRILGKSYYLHRVIYKMFHNEEPNIIDHIDGNPLNNLIENLRSVDNQTNCKNFKRFISNTSGCTGVSFQKNINKWFAYIWVDYKRISLGYYENLNDAIKVRKEAEIKYKFHENHGRD